VKVCKFGGTSMADAKVIGQACDIVQADPERRIMVVSAPGKRDGGDRKVTDLLIACAEARLRGEDAAAEKRAVLERFDAIRSDLGLADDFDREIAADLDARLAADPKHRGRFADSLKAAGEDYAARLVAAELRRRGAAARYVSPREAGMLLSDEYGNAQLLPESYASLAKLARAEGIVVFPGFFGHTRAGEVVTFPRGGSDITGSILAAAVQADLYENFTDVDSVFAANPAIVPGPEPIRELTYHEMRELSYAGFNVLHEEAVIPSIRAGVPICVKNTRRPEGPGTRIVRERAYEAGRAVGIASAEGFCTIFVSKYLMNREIGFGRRVLQIFEEEGLSYEHMPSGIDNLSIILREQAMSPEAERHVTKRLRSELDTEDVSVERGLALIMIVGEGMRYAVGMAARATAAFARAGVNIEMMNQGSSEISMMFGVKAVDLPKAVQSLYKAFFKS